MGLSPAPAALAATNSATWHTFMQNRSANMAVNGPYHGQRCVEKGGI